MKIKMKKITRPILAVVLFSAHYSVYACPKDTQSLYIEFQQHSPSSYSTLPSHSLQALIGQEFIFQQAQISHQSKQFTVLAPLGFINHSENIEEVKSSLTINGTISHCENNQAQITLRMNNSTSQTKSAISTNSLVKLGQWEAISLGKSTNRKVKTYNMRQETQLYVP